ncbi:MAG: LPS export ABC transporter ATP-binding protein, partial [Acidisphaera sp.]|nr:LPS export ABC transporter ATP-binding protein [Acidisphaera sp.]
MSRLRVVRGGLGAKPSPEGPGLAARGVGKVYKKRPVVRNVTV